jgi:hypothetical protein
LPNSLDRKDGLSLGSLTGSGTAVEYIGKQSLGADSPEVPDDPALP